MVSGTSAPSDQQAAQEALVTDLAAEHRALDGVVAEISAQDWSVPTPAEGWSIHDQITHLAFFDRSAVMALDRPESFARERSRALRAPDAYMEEHLAWGRGQTPQDLLAGWRGARADLVRTARGHAPGDRIPWYGPRMSLMSFLSARLMETWAHGQDIADALGQPTTPTARLRHVAHLGVQARAYSYTVRGLVPPNEPVHVRLQAPHGTWLSWGPEQADDRVEGALVDFCLVVTQRRHVADTQLHVEGNVAKEWLLIAQAFAGPPGKGRSPNQFDQSQRP